MPERLKAVALPFRLDDTGFPAPSFNEKVLLDSIRTILLTKPGERVMRPTFGCYAHRLLFENMNDALARRAEFEIRKALKDWEPRIRVTGVQLRIDGQKIYAELAWVASDNIERETEVVFREGVVA